MSRPPARQLLTFTIMSKIELSADLNAKLAPGELQAPLFHILYRQTMSHCTAIVEGIETVGYFATFPVIQSYYASRGEAVPDNMLPRAEILAEPADEDNDIEEILHVPAWNGGLPVPRSLSTFQSVYPALNIANMTIAQNGEIERRRHAEKIIQVRNESIKNSFLSKLPHDVMDTMHQADFEPGQLHISHMDVRQTMAWAMTRFGGVPSEDVSKATLLVHKHFSVSDLVNANSLDIAITKRQAILSTLKVDARPSFFLIRPLLDLAGREHPAYVDLIKYHYTSTTVEDMSFNTLRTAVRSKYNDLVALHTGAITIWSSKQPDNSMAATTVKNAASNVKQAANNPVQAPKGKLNECHSWITGLECSDRCKSRLAHSPSCKGMCSSLKNAVINSRTFNSMSEADKTAARSAEQNMRRQGTTKPQGKQLRGFVKNGGTIASAPIRRTNGRATASAATEDDVVSSDED